MRVLPSVIPISHYLIPIRSMPGIPRLRYALGSWLATLVPVVGWTAAAQQEGVRDKTGVPVYSQNTEALHLGSLERHIC